MNLSATGRSSLSTQSYPLPDRFGMCRHPNTTTYRNLQRFAGPPYSSHPSPPEYGTDSPSEKRLRFDNMSLEMLTTYCSPRNSFHSGLSLGRVYPNFDQTQMLDTGFSQIAALQHVQPFADYPEQPTSARHFSDTLEPSMLLRQPDFSLNTDAYLQRNAALSSTELTYPTPDFEYDSTTYQPVALQDPCHFPDIEYSSIMSEKTVDSPQSGQIEDEEEMTGKPYARLIYEALMEAPGHRMMLRDLYEWFIRRTRKPQASGSNGWQNSIRHNLSMNQAFENDKSFCSPASSQSRKANSVWVLTDYAIKHGIQSTTRYRKPGSSKKTTGNRNPTVQRQKSGSRGGRATKRSVARLKYHTERLREAGADDKSHAASPSQSSGARCDQSEIGHTPRYEQQPPTPPSAEPCEPLYALPTMFTACDQISASGVNTYEADEFDYDAFFCPDTIPRYDGDFQHEGDNEGERHG